MFGTFVNANVDDKSMQKTHLDDTYDIREADPICCRRHALHTHTCSECYNRVHVLVFIYFFPNIWILQSKANPLLSTTVCVIIIHRSCYATQYTECGWKKNGCVSYSNRSWRLWKSIDWWNCHSVAQHIFLRKRKPYWIGVRACDLNMMWRINLHIWRESRAGAQNWNNNELR